jgi:hypothetical protein
MVTRISRPRHPSTSEAATQRPRPERRPPQSCHSVQHKACGHRDRHRSKHARVSLRSCRRLMPTISGHSTQQLAPRSRRRRREPTTSDYPTAWPPSSVAPSVSRRQQRSVRAACCGVQTATNASLYCVRRTTVANRTYHHCPRIMTDADHSPSLGVAESPPKVARDHGYAHTHDLSMAQIFRRLAISGFSYPRK